jgi:hypothetical protein
MNMKRPQKASPIPFAMLWALWVALAMPSNHSHAQYLFSVLP